ncbi:MAG: hypothetical protein K6F09_02540 [Clostridiales bacterium]|nr:hypothetical protein [Clostridiales bacterium]
MSVSTAIIIIIMSVVAGAFAWAMRGTLLGGEKGAMLPGAVLGMMFAFVCGSDVVSGLWFVPAAVGACSMFLGGSQTYGETISLTFSTDKRERIHGRIGLCVKGAVWFGIFAGLVSLSFPAMAGKFSVADTIVLTLLIPVSQLIGFILLNYLPRKKEFLKKYLYFSKDRRERWGGLLFVCLAVIIFSAVKKEAFAVIMTVCGMAAGGLGFFIGNLLQTMVPDEKTDASSDGKKRKFAFIGGWKLMEFTFGAVGSGLTAICFCLCYNRFVDNYVDAIVLNSGVKGIFSPETGRLLTFIWLLILCAYTLVVSFTYDKDSRFAKAVKAYDDLLILPVFSYFPFFLAVSGITLAASLISSFLIIWVLAEEFLFATDKKNDVPRIDILKIVLAVFAIAALCYRIFLDRTLPAFVVFALYCVLYEASAIFVFFGEKQFKRDALKELALSGSSELSVRICSLACVIIAVAIGAFIFI